MSFTVIVTLGPSILNDPGKLEEIHASGPCFFRINGAHSDAETASITIDRVKALIPDASILIDLPGNKIRTSILDEPVRLIKGENFMLYPHQLNYPGFCSLVEPGSIVHANDAVYEFEVLESSENGVLFKSRSDGMLHSNKGLHVPGINASIPFLFKRDLDLLELSCRKSLDHVSLSFVRDAKDVDLARTKLDELGGQNVDLIAKIETASAVKNINEIAARVAALNIDRGDLSADVGLLALPAMIDKVVARAFENEVPIFLATQFLKNMEESPVPLLSEICDMYRVMKSGLAGIQLSEETAIGRFPVECVQLVFDLLREVENGDRS